MDKLLQRVDKCLITCNEQLTLITERKELTECRALQKTLLRKKYKKYLFSSFQKTKTTQTNGSVFAERNEKVKKTKFEMEKIVDCFLDGHGNYGSNLVSFKKNLCTLTTFRIPKRFRMNQLFVQMI